MSLVILDADICRTDTSVLLFGMAGFMSTRIFHQTGSLLRIDNTEVGVGFFQNRNHLFGRNLAGVVDHRVDLARSVPSAGHLVNAGQPVQGCFADIVSFDRKHDAGKPGLLRAGRSGDQPAAGN